MKKIVVLSFDDGRKDTYYNAVRIMNEYSLKGTINVTTGFVDGSANFGQSFLSADNKAMSIDEVKRCDANGFEIATHSNLHRNDVQDITISIEKLKKWSIYADGDKIGFASPGSKIGLDNYHNLKPLIDDGVLLYIRTGTRAREKGLIYAGISWLNQKFRNNRLFWYLNKDNINIRGEETFVLKSVCIKDHTTVNNIKYLLSKITPPEQWVILMFHSVLTINEPGYGKDSYYFDAKKFDEICKFVSKNDYSVMTTKDALALLIRRQE
jgi:hypothetical protein